MAEDDLDPSSDDFTERITVRVTKYQKHMLLALTRHSQELSYGPVVRKLLQGIKVKEFPAPKPPLSYWNKEAIRALGKIGTNINQIARELNRHERQGVDPAEFQKIDLALMEIIAETFGSQEEAHFLSKTGLTDYINRDQLLRKKFRDEQRQTAKGNDSLHSDSPEEGG